MKDYSKMSDLEIDRKVGDLYGVIWADLDENYHPLSAWSDGNLKIFCPCNSPADAWPIMHEYGVSLCFDEGEDEWVAFGKFKFDPCGWDMKVEPKIHQLDKNPLRAAMIVYLMMNEVSDE